MRAVSILRRETAVGTYLEGFVVALFSEETNKLVELSQLHLGHVDLLLLTNLEDFLDDAVRQLEQLLAQVLVWASVLASAVQVRSKFKATADGLGSVIALVVLGVDEGNVCDIVGLGKLVVVDETCKALVRCQNDGTYKVDRLPGTEVIQDTKNEDARRILAQQLQVSGVTLDEKLHDLLLERLRHVLAVAANEEVTQRCSSHYDLVKPAALFHDPAELLKVDILGDDV